MMIKLVAADMDGTLLNSKKELSPNLFNLKYATASTYIACGSFLAAAILTYSIAFSKSFSTPSPL